MSGSGEVERGEGQAYHHGDLAQAALAEALRIIGEDGAEALSLRGLAGALGVTHKALYRHYPSKAVLLSAIATEGYLQLAAALTAAAPRPDAFCRAYLEFARANGALYRLMMSAPPIADASERPKIAVEVIEAARRVFQKDDDIKRVWMILHGGLALHELGTLEKRSDADFIDFMVGLAAEGKPE